MNVKWEVRYCDGSPCCTWVVMLSPVCLSWPCCLGWCCCPILLWIGAAFFHLIPCGWCWCVAAFSSLRLGVVAVSTSFFFECCLLYPSPLVGGVLLFPLSICRSGGIIFSLQLMSCNGSAVSRCPKGVVRRVCVQYLWEGQSDHI